MLIHITNFPYPLHWANHIKTGSLPSLKLPKKPKPLLVVLLLNTHDKYVHKAISKYRLLYAKNPKQINRKVFKTIDTPPLDSLIDNHNNILTHLDDIATKIHRQQSLINRPIIPTCLYQPDYHIHCTCVVRQYPWHDLVGFTREQRGQSTIPLHI